ncbi:unnamed protein product, partial [Ectocarpus sp. 6 AP-2014]
AACSNGNEHRKQPPNEVASLFSSSTVLALYPVPLVFFAPPPAVYKKPSVASRRCTAAWSLGNEKPSRNNKKKPEKYPRQTTGGNNKMSRHICKKICTWPPLQVCTTL